MTGNVEPNGTSIVDVTDPTRPRYLKHLPGGAGVGEAGGAQMVRACNGSELPNADKSKVYILRATSNSHEVYDVTDPSNPELVSTVVSNLGRHAQELLGMRHGDRLPRIRRHKLRRRPFRRFRPGERNE